MNLPGSTERRDASIDPDSDFDSDSLIRIQSLTLVDSATFPLIWLIKIETS